MLGVSTLLLAVSALAKGLELARHLLDGPSEVGQLASDGRYVLSGCHVRPDSMFPGFKLIRVGFRNSHAGWCRGGGSTRCVDRVLAPEAGVVSGVLPTVGGALGAFQE